MQSFSLAAAILGPTSRFLCANTQYGVASSARASPEARDMKHCRETQRPLPARLSQKRSSILSLAARPAGTSPSAEITERGMRCCASHACPQALSRYIKNPGRLPNANPYLFLAFELSCILFIVH
ncbi:hypothetical protein LZ32DRAFT_193927 [Colletotrichum eremochloae]|nr:hypothetical protein LZ32DRAFT_193927 [Colletotrichum eremochloae]